MSFSRVGEEGRLLAVVLLSYIAFYGAFLLATDGLPYVLDNNESFSSLWHAANLYNFGISNSFGIADEAFAFHAAAHPYVHTHQGNFPRVFAYLIYLLGARSIEAQIVVTTYTVGVAAIVLAYRFFARAVTPLFGLIACLILITDYMLVAQWQVVTYRVWHEFFVFSSPLCVHACASRYRWWRACTLINFACLFYFELVFVAFVTITVALYAIVILRDERRVAAFFTWVGAGAVIGLGVLLIQLTLLLGWQDVKQDAYLTFVARNQYLNNPQLLEQLKDFYSSRNIVFWYNLEDGSRFRTPGFFVASITHYELQVRTPLLISVAGMLIGGFLVGLLSPKALPFIPNTLSRTASWFHALAPRLNYPIFITSTLSVLGITLLGDWPFGINRLAGGGAGIVMVLFGASLIIVVLIANSRTQVLHRLGLFPSNVNPVSRLVCSLFLLFASIALFLSWIVYDQSYAPLWDDLLTYSAPGPVKYLVLYLAIVIAALLAASDTSRLFHDRELRGLKTLAVFLACAFTAYCFVYALSPGYVFTGYKLRYVPFSVFHTNAMLALAAFILVVLTRRNAGPTAAPVPGYALRGIRLLALVLLALLAWYWMAMQLRYFQLMPADNYHFLKRLEEAPYKGKSFIVSKYAAPIAAATGEWAYLHSALSNNRLTVKDGRYVVELDPTYLWFADKKSNPAYRQPDYFICATAPIMWSLNEMVRAQAGLSRDPYGCWENVLVQLAASAPEALVVPALRLVEVDAEGPSRVGFQRWAIVKLLWDDGD